MGYLVCVGKQKYSTLPNISSENHPGKRQAKTVFGFPEPVNWIQVYW